MKNFFSVVLLLFISNLLVLASEPLVWSVNSRTDVLKGDAHGVSIDQNGTISLAPRLTEVFKTEQQYIWSSTVDAAGNVYLGTGGDGKVFKVDAPGKGTMFADFSELNVSALAVGPSGEVYAATSPDGKVYRLDSTGKSEVYFEPKEKYIWSLAVLADGLAVGTGEAGKIFKVKGPNASPASSLFYDTSENHIISLAVDRQGNLIAGTDSNGIVMRFGSDGKPFGLLDSSLREIHEIAVGPDGSVYVLALAASVSAPKPEAEAATAATTESKTVSVEKPNPAVPETPAKSRYDLSAAKSAVYRVLPDGSVDVIWASPTVIGFSLLAGTDSVWIGTSDKGRIYSISNDGREKLVLQTDANQISTLLSAIPGIVATSSNQGAFYRITPDQISEATYESAVLDAKGTANWGRIWWKSNGSVSIQTRSGNTEKPDETWSTWVSAGTDQSGAQVTSPRARYFQWKATLKPRPVSNIGGDLTRLSEVNLAFVARNIAPEILSIQILPTNVGLAANPPVQIDPNIELAGMSPAEFGIPVVAVPPRKVYQRGATSLQWTAEDRNGDKLVYDVMYREVGETDFKPLRTGLAENFIAIDGQSLADGRYVFKIVAKDSPSNPAPTALAGEMVTEPLDIDNTPPTVTPGAVSGTRVTFTATDKASYLVRAEYSINGGDWKPVYADDGISDSPTESYTIDVGTAAGEQVVTLRVFDANRNSGNARQVVRR